MPRLKHAALWYLDSSRYLRFSLRSDYVCGNRGGEIFLFLFFGRLSRVSRI